MYQAALDALYDVTEVSTVGGIPATVVTDALKLVNPGLDNDHAASIVAKYDARGKQLLGKEEFQAAVRMVLQSTDTPDAIQILRDLVSRMRLTFRRRYLMYEAPVNQCPPPLTQNATAVAMYRELFDVVARGDDYITRPALKALTLEVLADHPTDAANVVKAALGETERDLIGFEEFIMVMQPASARRPLSEMVDIAKGAVQLRKAPHSMSSPTSRFTDETTPSTGAMSPLQYLQLRSAATGQGSSWRDEPLTSTLHVKSDNQPGIDTPVTSPPKSGVIGSRPKAGGRGGGDREAANSSTLMLHHELEAAKQHHHHAEETFQHVVITGGTREHMLDASLRRFQHDDARYGVSAIPTPQEREMAVLRLENESLRHALSQSAGSRAAAGESNSDLTLNTLASRGKVASGTTSTSNAAVQVAELRSRIEDLETELRNCRAQLALRFEATQLTTLLKHHSSSRDALRNYYHHEESTLVAKHEFLRSSAQQFYQREGGDSAISIVLSQYDLVVCAYQTLFRDMKAKYDAVVAPRYDSVEMASSILPRNTPSRRAVTPSRGRATVSPARVSAAPMRWSEMDGAVTKDMKRTGTLRDPLLTDEERNKLRAKLATQMRTAARNYTPTRAAASRHLDDDEQLMEDAPQREGATAQGVATHMSSIQSLGRLQSMALKAGKQRNVW